MLCVTTGYNNDSLGVNVYRFGMHLAFLTLLFGAVPSVSFAGLFTVTQLTSEEAVFNAPTDTLTPDGLNNVLAFTVEPTAGGGAATQISTASYFGLQPATVDTPFPIQPKTINGTPVTGKLFADDAAYLSAGTQGLSLSTGINKITNQARETWFFPVIFIDPTAVNDGVVDFLVADIANNQSPDLWELLDVNDAVIASITPEGPQTGGNDWNRIGTQNLNRWRNSDNTLLNFPDRHLSAMALELSEFVGLTSANANQVASMRITIANPAASDSQPRTDYAFISSDINSIRFSNQVQPQPAPAPGALLLLLGSLPFLALFRRRAGKAARRVA